MFNALASNSPRRFSPLRRSCSLTNRLLTAETPLSYSDLERLHLTRRSEQHAQRVIPPWTYSREAIKIVILEKLKRYTGRSQQGNGPPGTRCFGKEISASFAAVVQAAVGESIP